MRVENKALRRLRLRSGLLGDIAFCTTTTIRSFMFLSRPPNSPDLQRRSDLVLKSNETVTVDGNVVSVKGKVWRKSLRLRSLTAGAVVGHEVRRRA
jgi:hypothetical protein